MQKIGCYENCPTEGTSTDKLKIITHLVNIAHTPAWEGLYKQNKMIIYVHYDFTEMLFRNHPVWL